MLGFNSIKFGYISKVLAQILYGVNSKFDYRVDDSDNVYIDNKGLSNVSNDLLMYSGRGIELTGTQSVDIPIHYTLGEELVTNGTFDTDTSGWTDVLGNSVFFDTNMMKITSTGADRSASQGIQCIIGQTYIIEFDMKGTDQYCGLYINTSATYYGVPVFHYRQPASSTMVHNIISFVATATTMYVRPSMGSAGSTAYFDNISVKEVTTENSFLTYQDLDTKEIVTLGNSVDGGSSKELVTNGTFDNDLIGWSQYSTTIPPTVVDGVVVGTSNGTTSSTIEQLIETSPNARYIVSFDVLALGNNDVALRLGSALGGSDILQEVFYTTGEYKVEFTAISSSTNIMFGLGGITTDVYWAIDNISVKEILPISTHYTFSDKTVNNILTHTTNWSESDRIKIENNPNLIGKLALSEIGSIDELDMELVDGDGWYPCSEKTLSTLYDARGGDSATIANYIETIRTNSDFQNTGLQTTAFIKDTLNVPISYDDTALNWDGGGYGDTQFMPPDDSPWEIDLVMETLANSETKLIGCFIDSTSEFNCYVGQSVSYDLYARIGTTLIGSTTTQISDGLHHIRLEFDGSGSGRFVIDNTIVYSYSNSNYTYNSGEKFFIGAPSANGVFKGAYAMYKPTSYFQYVNKERTPEERNADYLKWLIDDKTAMVLQFDTTIAGASGVGNLTIPAGNVGTYDAIIDWGDGTTSTITSYNDADLAHTYSSAGTYIVKITGIFPNIRAANVGDKLKLIKVLNLGNVTTSFERSFYGCSNMTEFNVGTADTSNITNTVAMFRECSSLNLLDLNNFNTSSVTNMYSMFNDCSSLTSLDISNFNIENVVNFGSFMNGTTIQTSDYDAILNNFASQDAVNGLTIDFGSAKYSSAGADARQSLIDDDSWIILDGGAV